MRAYTRKSLNKRGDELTDNVITLVIAVILIAGFVTAGVSLYNIFSNQETQSAQSTISSLYGKANSLEPGQNGSFIIQGFKNSQNWIIEAWGASDADSPEKCNYQSCVCICQYDAGLGSNEPAATYCQKNGFCRILQVNNAESFYTIPSSSAVSVSPSGITSQANFESGKFKVMPLLGSVSQIYVNRTKEGMVFSEECTMADSTKCLTK